jgi:outer membrane biosynthesis protein TonB
MSFNTCVRSLGLNKKLPIAELRALAGKYQAAGMEPEEALRQVVRDKLALARMEEQKIIRLVREQYEAQGGARRPQPEPAAAPAPEPEPQPAPQPEPEPAAEPAEPAPAVEEAPDTGEDIPLAFYARVRIGTDVFNEETGITTQEQIPADQVLAAVNDDIANLTALLKCMKGG